MNRLPFLLLMTTSLTISACSPINSLTPFDRTQAAILIEDMKVPTKPTNVGSERRHPNATGGTSGGR